MGFKMLFSEDFLVNQLKDSSVPTAYY